MQLELLAVIGVAVVVATVVLSKRLGVAAPVLLVVLGVGLSYLPGMPPVSVPQSWILDGVLPLLLYAAAIRVPVEDFRRNVEAIASLSFALVVCTALGAGLLLHLLLPRLGLGYAFALGAIVSPPDAVAATAVGRRYGLPPRLLTLLEGEGLLNDATALVLLRSATAFAAGTTVTWLSTGTDFLRAVLVAVAVGLAAGWATVLVRSRFSDAVLDTAVSVAVPFVAFVPATALGGSGVLAVVVAGLCSSVAAPNRFTAQARISDRINWRTIGFLLENAVFLVMGLELRSLIQQVAGSGRLDVLPTFGIGLILAAGLTVLRFAWISPLVFLVRLRERRAERRTLDRWLALPVVLRDRRTAFHRRRARSATRRYERLRADLEQLRAEPVDWKGSTVLAWSGMRGVVTLAAAQSLPAFPYRPQAVLIAFTVAIATLLLQGGTLPLLIRTLRVQGIDQREDREELAALLAEIGDAANDVLHDADDYSDSADGVDPHLVERARNASVVRIDAVRERVDPDASSSRRTPHRVYRQLRLAVLAAERERLLHARDRGAYSTRVLARAQRMLDLEETRLHRPHG